MAEFLDDSEKRRDYYLYSSPAIQVLSKSLAWTHFTLKGL